MATERTRTALEQRLIASGRLAETALDRALTAAVRGGVTLEEYLVRKGLLAEPEVLEALADVHGMRYMDLHSVSIAPDAVKAVPARFAAHYGVMPLQLKSGLLTLAVASPTEMRASEDIETSLGFAVDRVLASAAQIQAALQKYYGVGADTVERLLANSDDQPEVTSAEESHDLEKMAEDTSVVNLVNQLIKESIASRATDIHLEVYRDGVVARRRIDGILYDVSVPVNIRKLYPGIVSRIKLMSGLNIVERRMPQDGRANVKFGSEQYDLRISVVPAIHGEDVVIRILPSTMIFDLVELGFSDEQVKSLESYISTPHGIMFVTGPTGSGKSTTLYACLSKLNTRERKIITIEDPVEYEMRGVTQTAVNPRIGLSFAHALRSMLRHDPDVMLVGEVRDHETAEIAIQTAMTGHLVLSSLHTNDAAGAAVRLIDMGVDPYLIASTVLVFVAQRLVRVICVDCKESYEAEGRSLFRGRGCDKCNHSGFRGRMAISEMIPVEGEVQRAILNRASASEIRAVADQMGLKTMAQDGWEKVERGLTTAEEVIRVTRL